MRSHVIKARLQESAPGSGGRSGQRRDSRAQSAGCCSSLEQRGCGQKGRGGDHHEDSAMKSKGSERVKKKLMAPSLHN